MSSRNGEIFIAGACRTPIGKFLGGLSGFKAPQLGALAIQETLTRTQLPPDQVDEVIMGQVVQAGSGQAPARQAAIHGGIPPTVGAMTVNKVCGSGLKAAMLAAQAIKAGDAGVVIAGGMECMSQAPFLLPEARTGLRLGGVQMADAAVLDGLWDSFNDFHMGSAAELIARKFNVTREDQDRYALESHEKAVAAQDACRFSKEIFPVMVAQRKGEPLKIAADESPRRDTSLAVLGKLKPAFEAGGSVTAGNAPGLNDGAAAMVVLSAARARDLGVEPEARIVDYATGGAEPEMVFYAPVVAVEKLMEKMGVGIDHWDLIEANEAFAAQALVDGRELEWDWSRVNVNGGAIALGHPIGASGARILATLIQALKANQKRTGLATLCLGGGNAVAMAIELV
jgi:acetyl-CoA C-acetyltransferase